MGGGFAGLTLAGLLRQNGLSPVIVEKSPRYEPVGYVIGLWPVGSRVLRKLNLYERYLDVSVDTPLYEMRDTRGALLQHYDLTAFFKPYGPMRCVMRFELLQLLLDAVGAANVRMGITPEAIDENENEVHVQFSDGSKEVFDFVVGCDGIHSRTRTLIFGDLPLRQTGWAGWAWWIDPEAVPPNTILEYYGVERYFGIFPAKAKTCCFTGHPAKPGDRDERESRPARIRQAFADFGGIIPSILAHLPEPARIDFTRFADIQLEQWNRGRVLLIGDAGQGILPTAGLGASMAMESAAVLAEELKNANAGAIPQVIDAFVRRRRARVERVQSESWKLANLVFSESPIKTWAVHKLMRFYSAERLFKGFIPLLEGAV